MATKRKTGLKTLVNLILLGTSLFSIFSNILELMRVEARIAGKSLAVLWALSWMMCALIISAWFCVLGLILMGLIALQWTWMWAIFSVLVLNLLLILLVTVMIVKVKKNLLFPMTRAQLHFIKKT